MIVEPPLKTPFLFYSPVILSSILASISLVANAEDDIERVEVKGNRYQHQLVTTQNQQVVTEQLVSNPITLADWLESIPGVTLSGQGGQFQSYSIRGFSKSRIKTEVNGVPILTDRRAGNSAAFLPNEFIEAVDVRKGPSAAYYGSDAMGGVISARLRHFDGAQAQVNIQPSNDAKSIAMGYGDDTYSVGAGYQSANNSAAANGETLNTAFDKFFGIASMQHTFEGFTFDTDILVSHANDIGKSSAQYPSERITIYPYDEHLLASLAITHQRFGEMNLGLHNQSWQSSITRVGERTNVTDYDAQTINLLWQNDFDGFLGIGEQRAETGGRWGVEWIRRAGVDISEQEYSLNQQLNYEAQLLDAEQTNTAIFVHQYGSIDDWRWGLSGRFDHIEQIQNTLNDEVSDTFASFSLSVEHEVSTRFNVKAEIGNAFRFATLSERYFTGETPRGTTVGNEALDPERSLGGQFSLEYLLTSTATAHLTAYQYNVNNYIERYRIDEETLSYRNQDNADIYGVEASVEWQQTDDVKHHVTYQYNRGENDNGQAIDDLNPDMLSLTSVWHLNQWQFSNEFSYRFEKNRVGDAETLLDDTLLWHINAQYQVSPKWQIKLFLHNLTNELYKATADEDAPWQPERSVALSIYYQH